MYGKGRPCYTECTGISSNQLKTVQKNHPQSITSYAKSENAGCYHKSL